MFATPLTPNPCFAIHEFRVNQQQIVKTNMKTYTAILIQSVRETPKMWSRIPPHVDEHQTLSLGKVRMLTQYRQNACEGCAGVRRCHTAGVFDSGSVNYNEDLVTN